MRRKGFTLIEVVMVLTVVFILAAIGIWRIAAVREEAGTLAGRDALITAQRMQALADMEGLSIVATTTVERLVELQIKLAAKGHDYYQVNPTNLATRVSYDVQTRQWRVP
jgi:prepilin-type N-terminal cleavage/methylation domain-containing protein